MGDGLLAYFGWPRAHEDHGERAVPAGLALIEAAPEAPARGPHWVCAGGKAGFAVQRHACGESQGTGIFGRLCFCDGCLVPERRARKGMLSLGLHFVACVSLTAS